MKRRRFLSCLSGVGFLGVYGCIGTDSELEPTESDNDAVNGSREKNESADSPRETNSGENAQETEESERDDVEKPDVNVTVMEDATRRRVELHLYGNDVGSLNELRVKDSEGEAKSISDPTSGSTVRIDGSTSPEYTNGEQYLVTGYVDGDEIVIQEFRSSGERPDDDSPSLAWADLRVSERQEKKTEIHVIDSNIDSLIVEAQDGSSSVTDDLSNPIVIGEDIEYHEDSVYKIIGEKLGERTELREYRTGSNGRNSPDFGNPEVEIIEYFDEENQAKAFVVRVLRKGEMDSLTVQGPDGETAVMHDLRRGRILVGDEKVEDDAKDLDYSESKEYIVSGHTDDDKKVIQAYIAGSGI